MNAVQAVVLGIVQGATEFLPVSSSGHLVLMQNLFGLKEPELLFDVSVHVGTLIAVCVVFAKDIGRIASTLFRLAGRRHGAGGFKQLYRENKDVRIAVLIVIGSVPTGLLGVLFHGIADQLFGSVAIVGVTLFVTGAMLWMTRWTEKYGKNVLEMGSKESLSIGLLQGFAILPGISRSGATISMALYLGVDREVAGRFSFLLSIPAISGALLLTLRDTGGNINQPIGIVLAGGLVAAVVCYICLKILLRVVKNGRLHLFAPYCWLLGTVALLWHYVL